MLNSLNDSLVRVAEFLRDRDFLALWLAGKQSYHILKKQWTRRAIRYTIKNKIALAKVHVGNMAAVAHFYQTRSDASYLTLKEGLETYEMHLLRLQKAYLEVHDLRTGGDAETVNWALRLLL